MSLLNNMLARGSESYRAQVPNSPSAQQSPLPSSNNGMQNIQQIAQLGTMAASFFL